MRSSPLGRRWSRSSRSTTRPASSSRSTGLRRGFAQPGSLLLADCAQSAGKLPLPDADFIAACAHKLGGPPGIGVLLVRDLATLGAGRRTGEGLSPRDSGRSRRAGFAAALAARPYDMDRLARRFAPGSRRDVTAAGGDDHRRR